MVSALSVVLLAALSGGALAASPRVNQKLNCQNNKEVCWSHVHSDVNDAKVWVGENKTTCAILNCDGDKTSITITTPDYHVPVRTYIRPVDGAGKSFSESELECGEVAFNVSLPNLPIANPGDNPVAGNPPGPVDMNEDYAQLLAQQQSQEAFDLNADYAQMLAAVKGRRATRNAGLEYSVDQAKCRSGKRPADSECPKRFPHSQHTLIIKEYFSVSGTPVDILTITHLVVECDICVDIVQIEPPVIPQPRIKLERTAQCQWSQYSCVATVPSPYHNIDIDFSQVIHPAYDPIVGWQIGEINYGEKSSGQFDVVIHSNVATAVGGAISATVTPPSGQPVSSYLVQTDNVVEDKLHPTGPRLHVGCEAEYCYKGPIPEEEGVTVCRPTTPNCH